MRLVIECRGNGVPDAQYVLMMMMQFLTKYPNTKTMPVGLVLLFALKDTFPCEGQ